MEKTNTELLANLYAEVSIFVCHQPSEQAEVWHTYGSVKYSSYIFLLFRAHVSPLSVIG